MIASMPDTPLPWPFQMNILGIKKFEDKNSKRYILLTKKL